MRVLLRYQIIVMLSIPLLLGQLGCAHRPQVKAPPLPKFTEGELGTIAVVSACFEPEFKCPHKPLTKGKAVATGALVGFLGSILGGAQTGDPFGFALGIALSPVVAAGGAIYGAIEGETAKTIEKTEETLNHCLTTLRTQEVMQKRILSLLRERAQYTFVEPEQCGPNGLDEEITYDSLRGKGVDTVFEISVLRLGLWREKDAIDPPLSLFMTVGIRLIRAEGDTVLANRTFRYESREKLKFIKWAKKDAQPFKEEFDRACQTLAKEILEEFFLPIKDPKVKDEIDKSTTETI